MFAERGIGAEDLKWIQRDQFVYYVEMEHQLSDPHNWSRFRENLAEALNAALGLDSDADRAAGEMTVSSRRRRVLQVLEEIRCEHDPVTDWSRFFDAMWERRRALRDDL